MSTNKTNLEFSPMKPSIDKKFQKAQWRALISFCFVYLFFYTGRMNMGIVLPLIRDDLNFSHASVGIIASGLFWAYAVGQLFSGRLSDKFGSRIIITLGGLLSTVFNFVVSFMSTLGSIAFFWIVNGFFQAMGWAPGLKFIAQWWPKKERGRASGWTVFAAGWATVLVWVLTGWAADLGGWRWAFRIPVLFLAAASIIFYFIVRERPSDMGFEDYVEEDEETAAMETLDEKAYKGIGPWLTLFSNWRFTVACLVIGVGNVIRYGLLTWIPTYYLEVGGFDITAVVGYSMALPIGMALGPLCAGYISDVVFRSKRYYSILGFMLGTAVCVMGIALIPVGNVYVGLIFMFLGGFFGYGAHGPLWALATDFAGRKMAGTATGTMDFVAYVFAALQAVIFGIFLTLSGGNWVLMWSLVAGMAVIGAGLIFTTKR